MGTNPKYCKDSPFSLFLIPSFSSSKFHEHEDRAKSTQGILDMSCLFMPADLWESTSPSRASKQYFRAVGFTQKSVATQCFLLILQFPNKWDFYLLLFSRHLLLYTLWTTGNWPCSNVAYIPTILWIKTRGVTPHWLHNTWIQVTFGSSSR